MLKPGNSQKLMIGGCPLLGEFSLAKAEEASQSDTVRFLLGRGVESAMGLEGGWGGHSAI